MASHTGHSAVPDESAQQQAFLTEVFGPLHRVEQRRWARAYLHGLLHSPGKKTPRNMARTDRLPPAAAHGLHQFVNASTWAWEPVRRRLAQWVAADAAPHAWTVAELVIPKRGEHSVGVHRVTDPVTGRTVNAQRAVGLFLVTDAHCHPVDWSLVLDGVWGRDRDRRLRARVPAHETARQASAHVVDHAAQVTAHPLLPRLPWALDLTRGHDAGGVLAGLARHTSDLVCEVDPGQVVISGHRAPTVTTVAGLFEQRRSRRPSVMTRDTADGRHRAVTVHTYAGTVRLPRRRGTDGVSGAHGYRLLEVVDPTGRQPGRYWITSPGDRCVEKVLLAMRGRATLRAAVGELRERFGVLDFEGRSFPGWHHHMTMASAAYVYHHLHGGPGATAARAAG
ncbi:transposase [Streptomyces zhihengii]|uniref:Transposase n=1 Tax=Streptomyces zhihengii TaxID=1818004 RepID=A0ABS2V192_9ACTN|nr:transposase [Streptomyces zhihengii]MBM9623596.1 transposase [Streptomyces zhihengii]